jgi:hypothetical protein
MIILAKGWLETTILDKGQSISQNSVEFFQGCLTPHNITDGRLQNL